MRTTLRFRITPETLRVEIDGAGVVLEEEAALALCYDARAEDALVCAVGRDAVQMPEHIRTIDFSTVPDPRDRRLCIVPIEDAKWYAPFISGTAQQPENADPWEHHGEIVIVHPFAPGAGSARTWLALLDYFRHRVFSGIYASRTGFFRRLWLRLAGRVDIVLPAVPSDDEAHDELVRGLWSIFGGHVLIDGVPAKLRRRTRFTLRDSLFILAPLALASAAATLGPLVAAGRLFPTWLFATMLLFGAACSLLFARDLVRDGPRPLDPTSASARALRAQLDAGPDADPRGFAGVGDFRLGLDDGGETRALAPPVLLTCACFLARRWLDRQPQFPGPEILIPLFTGTAIAMPLAAARVMLGARGITLRMHGWFGRPLRIPYARIRHLVQRSDGMGRPLLDISFRGGRDITVGYRFRTKARAARLAALEAAITARLAPPASYRAPGDRVAG